MKLQDAAPARQGAHGLRRHRHLIEGGSSGGDGARFCNPVGRLSAGAAGDRHIAHQAGQHRGAQLSNPQLLPQGVDELLAEKGGFHHVPAGAGGPCQLAGAGVQVQVRREHEAPGRSAGLLLQGAGTFALEASVRPIAGSSGLDGADQGIAVLFGAGEGQGALGVVVAGPRGDGLHLAGLKLHQLHLALQVGDGFSQLGHLGGGVGGGLDVVGHCLGSILHSLATRMRSPDPD